MLQPIKKEDEKGMTIIVKTSSGEELDLSEFLFMSPDDEESILTLLLDPPEFNANLLRAQESYKRLFRKDS